MLAYIYLVVSICMAIASFLMMQQEKKMMMRVLGLIMGYLSAAVALKVYYMLWV